MPVNETHHTPNLNAWFSPARMNRFAFASSPEKLYIWNNRLSKALLEDIAHVEVLLRNWIDHSMNAEIGNEWMTNVPFCNPHYNPPQHMKISAGGDRIYTQNIHKAARRAGGKSAHKDKIIAKLSFDHWRFLLTSSKEPTVWMYLNAICLIIRCIVNHVRLLRRLFRMSYSCETDALTMNH